MTFWLARDKWPDRPHYRHEGIHLGEDDTGAWYLTPIGSPVYRAGAFWREARWHTVMNFAAGREWTAWFPAPEADSWFDIYCDIVTPIEILDDRTSCIDLDLDVVRHRDGRVEIVDRDEFEAHQLLFGYPEDVVASAERTAGEVAAMIATGVAPFDGRADHWLDVSRSLPS